MRSLLGTSFQDDDAAADGADLDAHLDLILQQAQAALNKANAASAGTSTAASSGSQNGTSGAPGSAGGKGVGKGKSKTSDGK